MLDDGQVQQFSEQGWIVADDVLSVAEVAELRTILQQPPFAERSFSEDHAVHFLNITTLHPKFLELAKDPRIVGRITPLLGPNIQLHHSKTCTKPSTLWCAWVALQCWPRLLAPSGRKPSTACVFIAALQSWPKISRAPSAVTGRHYARELTAKRWWFLLRTGPELKKLARVRVAATLQVAQQRYSGTALRKRKQLTT